MKRLAAALALAAAPMMAQAEDASIRGAWRITHGVVAPWTVDAPVGEALIGARVSFSRTSVKAPAPIGCRNAAFDPTDMPPEGLFQGGLPEPAQQHARSLGFAEGSVKGVSLSCDSGLWEFHRADADTTLFALDNVIWTLSRAYGTGARRGSPESVVEALLEFHFNHDAGFTEETAAARKKWLSKTLNARIDAYFARDFPVDEVPPIDGDPFTDTQEYPTRFAVRKGETKAGVSSVPVDFADGYSKKRIIYRLTYGGGWRVDDLAYDHDGTFKELLTAGD
ncbi:MAG: DUF3828 domain-containing protein [Parvularculaceae bacterium]